MTNAKLKSWGCINDDRCILFENASEDDQRLFLKCAFTETIWNVVKHRNGISRILCVLGRGA